MRQGKVEDFLYSLGYFWFYHITIQYIFALLKIILILLSNMLF